MAAPPNEQDLFPENQTNTLARWQSVVSQLLVSAAGDSNMQEPRDYDFNLMLCLDVSGSMAGKRINAMKLGICSLITSLKPTDRVYLMTFNTELRDISGGAITQTAMLPMLPALLVGIRADGGTAFYDAVLESLPLHKAIADAAAAAAPQSPPARNVFVALTDGEDTSSHCNLNTLFGAIMRPVLDNFMFLTVTVDMDKGVLRTLEPLFGFSHSKRIDVTVRTGKRLTSVFAETVALRMLRREEEGDNSFYSAARGPIKREGASLPPPAPDAAAADGDAPPPYSAAVASHRATRVRGTAAGSNSSDEEEEEEDQHVYNRCGSPAFDRCYSGSEMDDEELFNFPSLRTHSIPPSPGSLSPPLSRDGSPVPRGGSP